MSQSEDEQSQKEDIESSEATEKTLTPEEQLREEIQTFAVASFDSSVAHHSQQYVSLTRTLERLESFPEPYIRGLSKVVSTATWFRYNQPRSYEVAWKLVKALAKHDLSATARYLSIVLVDILKMKPNLTGSLGLRALPLAKWLLMLVKSGAAIDSHVVSALASLSYFCATSTKASRIFAKKLKKLSSEQLASIVAGLGALAKEAANLEKAVVALSFIAEICFALPADTWTWAPEAVTKTVLITKTIAPEFVGQRCEVLSTAMPEASFKSEIFPNIKKALLRSPEIAVYGVKHMLKKVSFTADEFCDEIMKVIAGSLSATDDAVRGAAVDAAVALAGRCSVSKANSVVAKLLEQISAAKTPEAKVALYDGVRRSAPSARSTELEKVACELLAKLAKADKESVDVVVDAQWQAAISWAQFVPVTSPAIANMFKEATKLPASIRSIGYRALANYVSSNAVPGLPDEIVKTLVAQLDTAQKEVMEIVPLAYVLLKTHASDSEVARKAWQKISTNENLLKEKTFTSMKWQDAKIWAQLIEPIILGRAKESAYPVSALKALSMLLFWPHWEVRRAACDSLKKILDVEQSNFAEDIADTILQDTMQGAIDQTLRKTSACSDAVAWIVPGEWYVTVLKLILAPTGPDLNKLAVHTLLLSSVQRLVEVDGSVWLRWMHENSAEGRWKLNEAFEKDAIELVLACTHRNIRDNALIMLSALNLAPLRDMLWSQVMAKVNVLVPRDYQRVTEKQVAIWKCPDGQLYNTEVLDFNEVDEGHNLRRENKAYSYKDQLAEIQLRREIAERKRKEGKLTPKQKQVMDKELAAEKEIRDEINDLYTKAEHALDEARAMVVADSHGAFARSSLLFDHCLPLSKSVLVSEVAGKLFTAYNEAAFPYSEGDDRIDGLIGSNWLRVVGSVWHDPNWAGEDLSSALQRMLDILNERAFVVDTGADSADDDQFVFEDAVGAPQLTLLYPLLKALLNGSYNDMIKNSTLQLLQSAIHRRFLKDNAVLQLPVLEYTDLLMSHHASNHAASSLAALTQLVGLMNDTEICGQKTIDLCRGVLGYLTHENHEVRESVCKILSAPQLLTRLVLSSDDALFARDCLVRLFVARFDDVEAVANAATTLWDASHFSLKTFMGEQLIEECTSPIPFVRNSASNATAAYIEEFEDEMPKLLTKIDSLYKDLAEVKPAVYDEVGRVRQEAVDDFERRSGIGLVLGKLALLVEHKDALQLIHIIVPSGLDDRNAGCRHSLCDAAAETIRRHGRLLHSEVLPFLEKLSDSTPAGASFDNLRQGLIVLLGTQAQYIDSSSDKVKAIVARLIEALSTPSQTVQEAVSKCLPPLVPAIKNDSKDVIAKMQWLLYNGESYGMRRGAAYGIAGIVKGMGMSSLKDLDLLPTVHKMLAEKKNANNREGGLLALEIMCSSIGKLFEPYMIKALPALLVSFGDGDANVRQAAEDTAKAMMGSMSKHGTKLILPALAKALDDDSWRTKCAATELLGSMAFCAPKQLSSCLPTTVPKLIEVLSDSSAKVQNSGEKALRQIAKVVRNPEILGVTNHLITGLLDPANKTSFALQSVLNTKFIHYIDAPSLALMMPIVRRAFEERNSETRRVAAQIIANMYSLTEHKDMEPYLADLVPGLQKSLIDPVPEIRTVSARALGSIVAKSTGATNERLRSEIIPWLKDKLISPQSTVDRSGAAQGLAEVLAGVGVEQLDYVMPEIIAATESTEVSAATRDGYILMYIYLPMVFGEKFVPYLPQVVPPILKALADENEYVRASALKAGQRLIAQFCAHARRLLLPQLQIALFDENWRIRHASVQLIGDFLFTISGVSGKSTTATADEDDTMGMEQAGKTIIRALGQQCRDRVLAGLYLVRSDVALVVRQAAGHVWKIVVSNTPRCLKEIMKTLFEMIVDSLASTCEERQQMAARCLGELVKKMGDKIIVEILPILEANQKSEDMEKRVGVSVALHEIIDNMSKDVLNHYLPQLVAPVRNAICDDVATVRAAAADTFSVLFQMVGHEALDEIITPLLEKLTPDQDHVLDGLCQVMKQNSRQMLPYLLPRLTKPPINVHALCSLASVAGDSLSRQLPRVLDALLSACHTNDQYDPMIEPCEQVVIAVTDEEGVPLLVEYLLEKSRKGVVPAAVLLHTFIVKSGVEMNDMAEELLPGLLQLYASENPQIVDHVILAAIGVSQQLDQKEQIDLLPTVKKALNYIVAQAKGKQIPGFTHAKALQPLQPMMREGILQGGLEIKALAGEMMSTIVMAADAVALKAHVVNLTGPLIRVLGDRYPPNVKLALIETLSRLLDKVDAMMRPFLPQLQSTFVKALQEPSSRPVRLAAGGALSRLLKIHPKPEPVAIELFKFLGNSQDESLLETAFIAARAFVAKAASKLTSPTIEDGYRVCESLFETVVENPGEMDNSLTLCAGALYGELAVRTDEVTKRKIFEDIESSPNPRVRYAKAIALQQMCESDGGKVWDEAQVECRAAFTAAFAGSSAVTVASAALRAASHVLVATIDRDLLSAVARTINHSSVDVRRVTAAALGNVFKSLEKPLPNDLLKLVVPQLVNGTKESNSAVRSGAELALVLAFKYQNGEEVFEAYRNSLEGAARGVLDEVTVCMRRIVKSGDLALDALENIPTVI